MPPSPRTLPEAPQSMKKGCLIALAASLLVLLMGGGCVASKYNGFVSQEETVQAQWTEMQNQYKRRADLIPQVVEVVKGVADFEQETLTALTEARASVGRAQLPDELPTDPAALESYIEAQNSLGGALGRLFMVSENYPTLTASQSFLSLQDQVEGTENRIAVARRAYIEAVKTFNTGVRSFPGNLFAGMFGFEKLPQLDFGDEFDSVPDIETPEIDFDR